MHAYVAGCAAVFVRQVKVDSIAVRSPTRSATSATPATSARTRRGRPRIMAASGEGEGQTRQESQDEQNGSHEFLEEASGATTERRRVSWDSGAAPIAAQWWARAWKVGCRSGGLAPKRLPRERDVYAYRLL